MRAIPAPRWADAARESMTMLPEWLPDHAATYLAHVAAGQPLRSCRAKRAATSTVLRQIRRVEARRDDPLIDEALDRMGRLYAADSAHCRFKGVDAHALELAQIRAHRRDPGCAHRPRGPAHPAAALREGRVSGGCAEHEKAVVLREVVPGGRTGLRWIAVAHAFALQEWIACEKAGKIASYAITAVGRAAR